MKVKLSKRAAIEFAATAAYVAAEFGQTAAQKCVIGLTRPLKTSPNSL